MAGLVDAPTAADITYDATESRPAGYPATLPFMPDRPVDVGTGAGDAARVGARWLCSDPDVLFAAVITASVAEGWRVSLAARRHKLMATADCALEREGIVRRIHVVRIDTLAIVQLADFPASFFAADTAGMRRS